MRAAGSQLQVADELVERGGRRGLPIYAWTIPERWDEPHCFDVAVTLVARDGAITTHRERFGFWPSPRRSCARTCATRASSRRAAACLPTSPAATSSARVADDLDFGADPRRSLEPCVKGHECHVQALG